MSGRMPQSLSISALDSPVYCSIFTASPSSPLETSIHFPDRHCAAGPRDTFRSTFFSIGASARAFKSTFYSIGASAMGIKSTFEWCVFIRNVLKSTSGAMAPVARGTEKRFSAVGAGANAP